MLPNLSWGEEGAGCQRISGKSLSFPEYPSSLCPTELDLKCASSIIQKRLGSRPIGLARDLCNHCVCDLCNHCGRLGSVAGRPSGLSLGKKKKKSGLQKQLPGDTFLGPPFGLVPGQFPYISPAHSGVSLKGLSPSVSSLEFPFLSSRNYKLSSINW